MQLPGQGVNKVEEVSVGAMEVVMVGSMETVGNLELVLGEVEAYEDEDFHVAVQELNTEEVAADVEAEGKDDTKDENRTNEELMEVMDVELTLDMEEVLDDAENEMVFCENASNGEDDCPLLLHPDRRVYMFTQAPPTHCCHLG